MGVLISIFKVNNRKTMRMKRGPRKISFRVTFAFLFFVSLFLFAPPVFAASYRYDSVDVDIDCISNDEVNVTVDIKVDMTSVLCWWVNYGGNTNISTKLTSVEAGMSKTSMKNLVLKSNGAKYKNEGAPPKDTAAYDSGDLLVYIAGSTFETYSQRFSGTAYIRYKTTLSNLLGVQCGAEMTSRSHRLLRTVPQKCLD